ncbi:MAG: hypothetical protein BWY63_01615 [Chloroflexi bacterium ADurb.Bin360]|nr:MAG: hypothetical protein BWY63_01615 [Chloroflexi bacterium ADurb.Bin360]
MDASFYFETLYPLQERVLASINAPETQFYLSGGTAASRGYLNHRFSDDLDLFVDDDDRCALWTARIIQELSTSERWRIQVLLREARFVRLVVWEGELALKVEFINDVPARVGVVQPHPVLGRLDSAENILANKVTAALDREEPKDLADIWGFCCKLGLSLPTALGGAQGKAAGVFAPDLARVLCSATQADWEQVRWITPPPAAQYLADLRRLGEGLLFEALT